MIARGPVVRLKKESEMKELAGSWGWVVLALFWVVSMISARYLHLQVLRTVAFLGVGVILFLWAGFHPPFFTEQAALPLTSVQTNPQGANMDVLIGFLFGFLAGGWGWIILIGLVCFTAPLVEWEHEFWAATFVALTAVILYFVLGWNVLTAIIYHPFLSIFVALVYFAAGAGWSLFKWDRYTKRHILKINEAKASFVRTWLNRLREELENNERFSREASSSGRQYQQSDQRNLVKWKGMPEGKTPAEITSLKAGLMSELERGTIPNDLIQEWHNNPYADTLHWYNNKERITTWIIFWPWSALSYIFHDLFRDFINKVMDYMGGMYQAVTNRRYAELDQRLIKKPAV